MPKSPEKNKNTKKKIDLSSLAILFLPVAFLLGIGGGWVLWGQDTGAGSSQDSSAVFNPVDDDPFIGPEDAPVTIVEFSDFECYYCIKWHNEVYDRLMTEYQGKIRFVYRDFPLTSIHPGAEPAARAANCAHEQDRYWDFHDAIFSGQYTLDRAGFIGMAADLDLDSPSFIECFDSGRYADEVQQDLQDALSIGVQSTPTFYINGFQVLGAQPYETFKSIIDQILAGD